MGCVFSQINDDQMAFEENSKVQSKKKVYEGENPIILFEPNIPPSKTSANQITLEEEPNTHEKRENRGDQYPIIWYEPDVDSKEKKVLKAILKDHHSINLFSKFQEAFQFAQALHTGFLLIAPSEVAEEELLKKFGTLEETYGRKYFDFEEETVLKGLFKEISEQILRSLNVYVFFTRQEFENEVPASEEEEEIMVMCDIKEMAKQFQEEFVVIWCDPEMSPESKELLVKEFEIEEKNIYRDFEDLLKKLENYNNELPYHLILSGKTEAERIIEKTDYFKDLLCLYIYDSPLIADRKKSRKVKIEKVLESLIPKITEGVRTNSKLKNTFPAFATQFDAWDKSHINKIHYYLRGFINFKNRRQAKKDFMNLAKTIYQSKKLFKFQNEYHDYNKEQILRWYAAESPIYKLINNCLRIGNSDSIIYSRFLLKDMERAIREEYQDQSKNYSGLVYRGAYITKEEFGKLGRNVGKEIEMYGFLSTSMSLKTAENFLKDDITNKVLIKIIIPPFPKPELDEQGYAELSKFSPFSNEEEILFNVRSRFQILEVKEMNQENKCRHLILLYGSQLLRKYIENEIPIIQLKLELPLEIKCVHCKSINNLFAFQNTSGETHIICRECFPTIHFAAKNTLFLPINDKVELNEERKVNIEIKGKILEFGSASKLAYERSYKCNQCLEFGKSVYYKWINSENEDILIECLECFRKNKQTEPGYLVFSEDNQVFWGKNQEKWEKVDFEFKTKEFEELESWNAGVTFDKAKDFQKAKNFNKQYLKKIVREMRREKIKLFSYGYLALIKGALGDHRKALEYHLKVHEISRSIEGESHKDTATLDSNLAGVYRQLGDYQKALEYNLKALDIRKSIYGESHPDTTTAYMQLALLYQDMGDYQKALEYNLKALDIKKFIYGESHPQTATSYNNLSVVYQTLGDYQKSLEYILKNLDILKSIYGESHPETANSYNNLASIYKALGHNQKAIESTLKALDILKLIYGESHPQTAVSYTALFAVYCDLGNYQKALEYNLKALDIKRTIFGELHPETAASYRNLALGYQYLGEYQKALEYYLKALDIFKYIYREPHSQTASSYNNLASLYYRLKHYQKALEYFLKALDILKAIYGEYHTLTATLYSNLAGVYGDLGYYQKALEYNLKVLDIRKSMDGESHSHTAIAYGNLAVVYQHLRDPQKALEYALKAHDKLKTIYGESHPETANLYENLAMIIRDSGDYQKALEYNLKALDIKRTIFGELHSETADTYCNLALVYQDLRNYQKALEYSLKALDIYKSVYGESHSQTVNSYNNIALGYEHLGDYQNALPYRLKVLSSIIFIFGESNPNTANSYHHLASLYSKLGDHQKALEYFLNAHLITITIYGESHLETATSHHHLATVYEELGDVENTLEHFNKATEIRGSGSVYENIACLIPESNGPIKNEENAAEKDSQSED